MNNKNENAKVFSKLMFGTLLSVLTLSTLQPCLDDKADNKVTRPDIKKVK